MALTANTIRAMAPWGGQGGTQAGAVLEFPATDGAIAKGDVLIFASGKVDEDNSAPLAQVSVMVGVALEGSSAANDLVRVAIATSGRIFEANFVAGTATDETGVFADNIGVSHGIVESSASAAGFAVIDQNNTTAAQKLAYTLFYARQQNTTQDADQVSSGVGVTNPRVAFVFTSSIFMQDTIA